MKNIELLKNNGVDLDQSLELFGDMGTYDQMLGDFLNTIQSKLSDTKKYKEIGDISNYTVLVHSLKSDCRYFGLNKLSDHFYEHEKAGKSNNLDYINNDFNSLLKESEDMVDLLKRYMNDETVKDEYVSINDTDKVIIVVDDSDIVRKYIERAVDYSVRLAENGEEAIDIVNKTPHEKILCMLLDLNMPNSNGFVVLDYLASNNLFDKIPVAIITGQDDKDTINKSFGYPIVDVITKPFNEVTLKNVIDKITNR